MLDEDEIDLAVKIKAKILIFGKEFEYTTSKK